MSENSEIIRNSSKNGGIRNHDSYYDKYYALLYDREKSEVYYNKIGKRYALESTGTNQAALPPKSQSIVRRIRANSVHASR